MSAEPLQAGWTWRRELVAGSVAGAVLAVAASWPLVTVLSTHAMYPFVDPDVQVGLWWPGEVVRGLSAFRNPFVVPELNWPEGQDVTLYLWNLGAELLFGPLHILLGPLAGSNLSLILAAVLDGLACGAAARLLKLPRSAGLVALIIGATCSYSMVEVGAGRPMTALWAPVPIYLAAFLRLQDEPGNWRLVAVAALSLTASGAIYWFYAYFLVLLSVLLILLQAFLRRLTLAHVKDLFRLGAISFVTVSPFLAPLVLALLRGRTGLSLGPNITLASQQLSSCLLPESFLGPFSDAHNWCSSRPPLLLLPVCAIGVATLKGPARYAGGLALLAVLFGMGFCVARPDGTALHWGNKVFLLPGYLLNALPGYPRLWWTNRWLGIAVPAFALTAAALAARLPRIAFFLPVFALWSVWECAMAIRVGLPPGARRYEYVAPPAVLSDLDQDGKRGPVLQVAEGGLMNGMVGLRAFHHQPINSGLLWHMKRHPPRNALEAAVEEALVSDAMFHGPWTAEETGGYRYVLLVEDVPAGRLTQSHGEGQAVGRLSRLLGPPFFADERFALWEVQTSERLPPGRGGQVSPLHPGRGAR